MGWLDDVGNYFKNTWESDRTFGAPEGSPFHTGLNKIGDFGGWVGENTIGTLVDAGTGLAVADIVNQLEAQCATMKSDGNWPEWLNTTISNSG